MAKIKITWLGDEDKSVESIEQFGHAFTRGKPTDVDATDAIVKKLEGNPKFSTSAPQGRPSQD